jgi:hypothetical protein
MLGRNNGSSRSDSDVDVEAIRSEEYKGDDEEDLYTIDSAWQ